MPTQLEVDYVFNFDNDFEEITLKAEDNAKLNGLHFKVENPKGVILYFHGNAGDLSRWGIIVQELVERQYDVIVMDYRTYGKSTGKLNEKALFSDARLWYDYTKTKFDANQITVYGRSLGSAIGTQLASQVEIKQLILETPFYNLADAANYRFWYLPTKQLLRYEFKTDYYIQDVACPKYFILATEDDVVSYKSGKRLYDCSPETKTLIEIKNATHNNVANFKIYQEFLNNLL